MFAVGLGFLIPKHGDLLLADRLPDVRAALSVSE